MRLELRNYDISPGRVDEFVEVWRTRVVPLRERFGFKVIAAFASHDDDRFVWVVGHDDDFEAAEADYYASPERKSLDPDPRAFIVHAETEFVRPVSP